MAFTDVANARTTMARRVGGAMRNPPTRSGFFCGCIGRFDSLEVDPFPDRQALKESAQTIERHLHRTQAHPLTSADDATPPGFDAIGGCDGEAERTRELDAVRA